MWLFAAGLGAGVLDAIVGGGGLITLPTLLLHVGPGAQAIGSNKIPGFLAAFVALLVYARRGHVNWRAGWIFTAATAIGGFAGSRASPFLPPQAFRILLLVTAPLVLGLVFAGRSLLRRAHPPASGPVPPHRIWLPGLLVGFYDGAWGPGGGTFMVLGLLAGAKLPLLEAMGTAKLANSGSALLSGIGYWSAGRVELRAGAAVAAGALIGATVGARLASRGAEKVARPALVVVAILLLWRVWSA